MGEKVCGLFAKVGRLYDHHLYPICLKMFRIVFRRGFLFEIQNYIFEFIQPHLTREDWSVASNNPEQFNIQNGKPRNQSWGVRYKDWSFYEKLRFSFLGSI